MIVRTPRPTAVVLVGTTLALGVALAQPAAAQDAATPTVTVAVPNRAPVATDDSALAQDGAAVAIDLFANDTDPDGDPLALTGGTSASRGTVSFAGSIATYTPDPGFSGLDSFLYVVTDGRGGSTSATVRITVTSPARGEAPAVQPRPWTSRPTVPAPAEAVTAPRLEPPAGEPPAAEAQQVTAGGPKVERAPVRAPARPAMGPSTTPYVAPVAARPAALPFTGADEALLPLGLGLLLGGTLVMAAGRRRTS